MFITFINANAAPAKFAVLAFIIKLLGKPKGSGYKALGYSPATCYYYTVFGHHACIEMADNGIYHSAYIEA